MSETQNDTGFLAVKAALRDFEKDTLGRLKNVGDGLSRIEKNVYGVKETILVCAAVSIPTVILIWILIQRIKF